MKKFKKMQILFALVFLVFATACKKNGLVTEPVAETPIIPPTVAPTPTTPVSVTPSYQVGTGSGDLTIDGKTLDLSTIKLIKIKGGNYLSVNIQNINGTASQPIYIVNDGQVTITNGLITNNITNVSLVGDYNESPKYGIAFKNNPFRAIKMYGKMSGVTLQSLRFTNIGDYCIAGESDNGRSLAYNGTSSTRTENFKILNCIFENTGSIVFGGSLNGAGEDTGFFKDVEIAYNTFKNSPDIGSAINFSNVQDYNVHHNIVDNVNTSNNNHNGIFYMQGNGKFHDNKLTNYQGNAIRMWVYSRGSTPATVEIYNNICYNTRKYGAFEIQEFSRQIVSGKTTYVNAKVYNNTVGKMNTNRDWQGQILDLYNYGGTLEFYSNIGFDLVNDNGPITRMINNMSDVKIVKEENNKYSANYSGVITDLVNFNTLFAGLGASL
ncbi:hypothetical protein [Pedobacter sp. Leaf170]|uniref:hypothetical protein n=1 Tax=Pedobacter sp. Leaf170 TaxID=2876558 RepID=UPI001E3B2BB3|nr:hypothetical protein [Pedobacter sp. Leaf170]